MFAWLIYFQNPILNNEFPECEGSMYVGSQTNSWSSVFAYKCAHRWMCGISLVWKRMNLGCCRRAAPLNSPCSINSTSVRPITSFWPKAWGSLYWVIWLRWGTWASEHLMVENPHQKPVDGMNFIRLLWAWSFNGRHGPCPWQEGDVGLRGQGGTGRLQGTWFSPGKSKREQLGTSHVSVIRVCIKWEKVFYLRLIVPWENAFWRHLVCCGVIFGAF